MQEKDLNNKITGQIEKMLQSERTVHAFLFVGGSRDERERIGMWLAESILCQNELMHQKFLHGNCEDFIVVEKPEDKESILKDQILELGEKLAFKPFSDKYVVLIKDAHLMNQVAQNKLLKSLEEPVSPAVFVLLAERADALLPTVRSRCTLFSMGEADGEYSEQSRSAAEEFLSLIKDGPCYYKKKQVLSYILSDKDDAKNSALAFLDALEEALEKEFISNPNKRVTEAVAHLENTRQYILQGHSTAYSLKQLCLRV